MIPGELVAEPGELDLNAGRPTITLVVATTVAPEIVEPLALGDDFSAQQPEPAPPAARPGA